jgi:lipoprotein-releasing system permease protein
MNLPFFIAEKLIKGRRQGTSFSRPINVIAIVGISAGLAVMILAVAILTGFKQQIRDKIVGFGSHIQVLNYDSNLSFETVPISTMNESFSNIRNIPGVKHIEVFATKAGIIKTDDAIQGVVLKGIGSDFDWDYFKSCMVEGNVFTVSDSVR